jgi:hypothetical protein
VVLLLIVPQEQDSERPGLRLDPRRRRGPENPAETCGTKGCGHTEREQQIAKHYLTFHSWMPADHSGCIVSSSLSAPVLTGVNVTLLYPFFSTR